MRDFILLLAPVALVIYFVIYPHQFAAFLAWISSWLRSAAIAIWCFSKVTPAHKICLGAYAH